MTNPFNQQNYVDRVHDILKPYLITAFLRGDVSKLTLEFESVDLEQFKVKIEHKGVDNK